MNPKEIYFMDYRRPTRKPCRSARELAEEFGVPLMRLVRYLALDGPAPQLVLRSGYAVRNSWYDPEEVRKWWKLRNAQ